MAKSTSLRRRRILKGLAGLVGLGAFLFGLLALGNLAFENIRTSDRYTADFSAIDCTAPPGDGRDEFLEEVQYLARMPNQLPLLEDGMPQRIAEAFARHPWVERVERVEIVPPGQIRVRLEFRVAALAVRGPGEPPDSSTPVLELCRAVDGRGILLPPKAARAGLPILLNRVPPPTGTTGTTWGDPRVEAAARTAGVLRPHQDKLHLEGVEVTSEGLVLRAPSVRILWGQAPGAERNGEASAAKKVERLLAYCRELGSLAEPRPGEPNVIQEHDVRPQDRAFHGLARKTTESK